MAGDRPGVRLRVEFLSREAQLKEKLRVYREELSRLKEEGAQAWVVRWYEERIRHLEGELAALGAGSGSSSSSSSSSLRSRSRSKGKR